MIDQEASYKIFIVSGEKVDATKPFLAIEVIDELLGLHDAGSDCGCSPRQTGDSSVDMRSCCNLKVPAFQVTSTKEVPKIGV